MALTKFQRDVCRLLAHNRVAAGEAYFAGGATLNELIESSRISRDVDLFHDTEEALEMTWAADRKLLESNQYTVAVIRERPSFVEAQASRDGETLLLQWARDSAYRFFPLIEHDELGVVLHPFDLATNKVLALVGRLEVRDWIDVINCNDAIQPLGYLAWAACGKDPGFSPAAILEHAGRSSHYSAGEVQELSFAGESPDPGNLSRKWHRALDAAKQVIALLPAGELGKCVLTLDGELYSGGVSELEESLERGELVFHPGSIRGAFPRVLDER